MSCANPQNTDLFTIDRKAPKPFRKLCTFQFPADLRLGEVLGKVCANGGKLFQRAIACGENEC